MDKNLKQVFTDTFSHLVLDSRMAKSIADYKTSFMNRNKDHVEFFGGNLTGVNVVRWTDADKNRWFTEVMKIDTDELRRLTDRIHSLPTINPAFNVSSDVTNLTLLWLAYALGTSTKLSLRQRQEAQLNCILVLNFKFITSLLFNYFKYPADKEIAIATYNALEYKFILRQLGSWIKVLEYRSEDILSDTSIHAAVFKKFDNDLDVVYAANDVQGRLRDMMKNIYGVFLQVHEQGIRVVSQSSVVEHDGVEALRDKTKSLSNYTRYLISLISDPNSLQKEELLQVIERMNRTMPSSKFRETLAWMSREHGGKHTQWIDEMATKLLLHAFDYLNANRSLMRNTADLAGILIKLRGTYTSSRNSTKEMSELRSEYEKMAKLATGIKNTSVLASIRTGVMLYLVIRALSMKHYTQ